MTPDCGSVRINEQFKHLNNLKECVRRYTWSYCKKTSTHINWLLGRKIELESIMRTKRLFQGDAVCVYGKPLCQLLNLTRNYLTCSGKVV